MPVRPVKRMGRDGHYRTIGYMWGHHGKLYTIRRWGKIGAHNKASRQGMAVKISQNARHSDKWEWFGKGKKKVRCPVCHQLYWRKHTCQQLKPANVTIRRSEEEKKRLMDKSKTLVDSYDDYLDDVIALKSEVFDKEQPFNKESHDMKMALIKKKGRERIVAFNNFSQDIIKNVEEGKINLPEAQEVLSETTKGKESLLEKMKLHNIGGE